MSSPNVKFGTQRGRGKRQRKYILYGTGSVGKTTLGASAPSVYMVCLEDGAREFPCSKAEFDTTTGRVYPLTFQEVLDLLDWLPKSGELKGIETLFLDGVHALDIMIQSHVVRQNPKWASIQTPGFGVGEAAVLDAWRAFVAKLDDLCLRFGLRLIMAGHAQITKFKNPEGAEYNRYDLAVTTHPKGDVAGFLFGWCDVFAFARFEQLTHEIGKRTIGLSQQGSRFLQLEWTNAYQAKCRLEGAPDKLPMTNDDGTPQTWKQVWGDLEERATERVLAEFDRLLPLVDDDTRTTVRAWLSKVGDDAVALGNGLRNLRDKIEKNNKVAASNETSVGGEAA